MDSKVPVACPSTTAPIENSVGSGDTTGVKANSIPGGGGSVSQQLGRDYRCASDLMIKYCQDMQRSLLSTQSDLAQCRSQTQNLETQLRHKDELAQRREREVQMIAYSRDEAVRENNRLLALLSSTEEREFQRVNALQANFETTKQESQKIREALESVMFSHNQLQHGVELLEAELQQKDSTISQLRLEQTDSLEKQRRQQTESDLLKLKLKNSDSLESKELHHLRERVHALKATNSEVSDRNDELCRMAEELKRSIRSMEEDLAKKDGMVDELTEARNRSDQERRAERKVGEEKLLAVKDQLTVKEKVIKRIEQESTEIRRQLEESVRQNADLSRCNAGMQTRTAEMESTIRELEGRLGEQKDASFDLCQRLRRELEDAMSKSKHYREEVTRLETQKEALQERIQDHEKTIQNLSRQFDYCQQEYQITKPAQHLSLKYPLDLSSGDGPPTFSSTDDTLCRTERSLDDQSTSRNISVIEAITEKAQKALQSTRLTMTRLSDYITLQEIKSQRFGGSPSRLATQQPLMSPLHGVSFQMDYCK